MKKKKKKSKNDDVLRCGKVLEGNKFKTPMGVLSFPALFKPEAYEDQEPKFKASIIWDEGDADLSLLKKVGKRCVKEKYGNKIPKKFNWPWRDGEEYEDTAGYGEGKTFITCSTKSKPLVIDRKKNPITDETEIFAGCFVRFIISPFVYEFMGKKGLSFALQAVQKLKEGEPFGSRADAEDFGDDDLSGFEDEELDDDLDDDDDDIDDDDF